MRKLTHAIVVAVVLGAFAWALLRGFRSSQEEAEDGAEKPPAEHAAEPATADEEMVVTLEKERWQSIGIAIAEPGKAQMAPHRVAFGRVLDPTPLAVLDSDLAAAEAAISASRAEYERTQKLLATGENMSRKAAETAEAQFRADESKLAGLHRQLLLQWGAAASASDAATRHPFVEALVRGDAALVRVDLLPGDAVSEQPRSAKLLVVGREQQPIETTAISPAADADPRTQAQGFILQVTKPPFALRPGMALTAWLALAEEAHSGFDIPRSAILRHDGRTWIFVQKEEDKFVRKPVALDTPLDTGWFVAEGGGVAAGDRLVVVGAQTLLSEEMKAAGGTAEEE
jgi:hypothetical protein